MLIHNPTGKSAIKTKGSIEELAQAISAVDLSKLPKRDRWRAIQRQMGRFILARTTDPVERDKPAFKAVQDTYRRMTGLDI